MGRARSRLTVTAAAAVAVLLSSMIVAYAAGGTGTVAPPPRVALVAHGVNPADALAAGPIASQIGAPIFTTSPNGLSDGAEDGLVAYAPEIVIVVGGAGALPDAILDEIRDATGLVGDDVRRVFGDDRYKTAQALSTMLADEGFTTAFLPVDATAMGALDADDSDMLDGLDSTDFVRGPLRTVHSHLNWRPYGNAGFDQSPENTFLASDATELLMMPLDHAIDDGTPNPVASLLTRTSFGTLTHLSICYAVGNGADAIDNVEIWVQRSSGNGGQRILDEAVSWNSTDHTCAAVPLPEDGLTVAGPATLGITYDPAAGPVTNYLVLSGVYATWDVDISTPFVTLP